MATDNENKKKDEKNEESKAVTILKKVLGGIFKVGKVLGDPTSVVIENGQKRQEKIAEKNKAENEKLDAETKEKLRKDIAEKLANPVSDCPHGKCVYCSNKFFFTCPKNQPCDKGLKKKHLSELGEVDDPRLIDYAIISDKYMKADENVFNMLEINKGKEYVMSDWCAKALMLTNEAFINEYYPNLIETDVVAMLKNDISPDGKLARSLFEYINLSYVSTKEDNGRFAALWMLPGFSPVTLETLMKCFNNIEKGHKPAILTIPDDDFYYLLEIIAVFFGNLKITKDFCDIQKIDDSMLFDKNGNLKRVGYGGEAVGETGDTIWNSVIAFENNNIKDVEVYKDVSEKFKKMIDDSRAMIEGKK